QRALIRRESDRAYPGARTFERDRLDVRRGLRDREEHGEQGGMDGHLSLRTGSCYGVVVNVPSFPWRKPPNSGRWSPSSVPATSRAVRKSRQRRFWMG